MEEIKIYFFCRRALLSIQTNEVLINVRFGREQFLPIDVNQIIIITFTFCPVTFSVRLDTPQSRVICNTYQVAMPVPAAIIEGKNILKYEG